MKIATWNVNSVAARLPVVLQWLKKARPDVLCMQELKCRDEHFPREAFAELGYRAEVYGQRTYNGVGIVARSAITDVERGFPGDVEGSHARLIAATVEGVRIVNVYVPNG
ncbi:MAG TPA: exodeoxyribonuclease III, partial [Pyrinomonadaceae bacterium]